MLLRKGPTILFFLLALIPGKAQDKKPCLIFSGNTSNEYAVDIMEYNLITLGEDFLTLSNKDNPEKTLELLYSAYNRFKIGEAEPSLAIEAISIDKNISLSYSNSSQLLTLTTDEKSDKPFNIGVFNIHGTILLRAKLSSGESISLKNLSSGSYVAIAIGNGVNKSLKIVK